MDQNSQNINPELFSKPTQQKRLQQQSQVQRTRQQKKLKISYPFYLPEIKKIYKQQELSSINNLVNNIENPELQKQNGFKLLFFDLNLQHDSVKEEAKKYIDKHQSLELFLQLREQNPELFVSDNEIVVVIYFENKAFGFYMDENTKKVYPFNLGFGFLLQLLKSGGIA